MSHEETRERHGRQAVVCPERPWRPAEAPHTDLARLFPQAMTVVLLQSIAIVQDAAQPESHDVLPGFPCAMMHGLLGGMPLLLGVLLAHGLALICTHSRWVQLASGKARQHHHHHTRYGWLA